MRGVRRQNYCLLFAGTSRDEVTFTREPVTDIAGVLPGRCERIETATRWVPSKSVDRCNKDPLIRSKLLKSAYTAARSDDRYQIVRLHLLVHEFSQCSTRQVHAAER